MKLIAASLIIAAGLVIGGFAMGGRYSAVPTESNAVVRLDRFTGDVSLCVPGMEGSGCGFVIQSSN